MNLVLLRAEDFSSPQRAVLSGRRFKHCMEVHQAAIGDRLRVGLLDGMIGSGQVISLTDNRLELDVSLTQQPPTKLPLTLLMALPRPKMLKRIFQTCATMGVAELFLINSYRVEKSYWQTPFLRPEKISEHLCLGLEQGIDTRLPVVHLRKRFKPFVEDELPAICEGRRRLVAHPYNAIPCPGTDARPTVLAIGPEGGFIQYEIDKLAETGFSTVELGPRILRVETALPVLLARLF